MRDDWTVPSRRYHPTGVFVAYCAVTVLVAVGAFNGNNNLLYWLFGLSLGMLLVSGLISGAMLMAVRVRREHIAPVSANGVLRMRYIVQNRSRFMPLLALHLAEEFAPDGPEPDGRRRARLEDAPRAFVAFVPPGRSVSVEGLARCLERGRARFTGVRITSDFPFGILRKSLWFELPASAVVRPEPDPEALDSILPAPRTAATPGQAHARARGRSDEFQALRPFVPGDALSSIAWKPTSRQPEWSEPLVRQSDAGAPARVWVRLEDPGSERERECSIRVAAGRIVAAQRAGAMIGLIAPAWNLTLAPRTGAPHAGRLLNELGLLGEPCTPDQPRERP